jgi:CDP-diacylglycerol--glycerol-3-phosphate 3-phosphatidyltransferase
VSDEPTAASARPLITANQVTTIRLLGIPFLSWTIYLGEWGLWVTIILGTVIGSTDFVDGYLARKHGPTVLGGLLDPVADKMFIVAAYTPLADLGIVPAWAVTLMFVREFLVTSMRSAYEQRQLSLKTSYLAKVKTWIQMQVSGMILLYLVLPRPFVIALLAAGAAIPVIVYVVSRLIGRNGWPSSWLLSAGFFAALLTYVLPNSLEITIAIHMFVVVGFTWLSGLDYLFGGLPRLYEAGGFHRADVVRLLSAISMPVLAFCVLVLTPAHVAPIIAFMAVEIAVGGLDNLLSHHRDAAGAIAWSTRTLGASALLAIALYLGLQDSQATDIFVIAALALSLIGVGRECYRGRSYYL